MSDYTVGHKNIYLEFPSFMGFLQKKKPAEEPIYPSRYLYTHLLKEKANLCPL